MSALEKTYVTPEQYLERERQAAFKSEYYGGEIFAMTGASEVHNLIAGNIFALLWMQMRGRPCKTYASGMRVQVARTTLYTYPDVSVVCGPVQFSDAQQDSVQNPSIIFEVLSPSTEDYDRGEKFALYRNCPTLTDYLLVSQELMRVEYYKRLDDGIWLMTEALGPEASVKLDSISSELRLADVYERVEVSTERNVLRIRRKA
jgi:Uma2 family endonuclease